jgi:hypothetical protein
MLRILRFPMRCNSGLRSSGMWQDNATSLDSGILKRKSLYVRRGQWTVDGHVDWTCWLSYVEARGKPQRQFMHKSYIKARSRNRCCNGEAASITYLCVCACVWVWVHGRGCALVALVIQHAMRHHIVTCGLSGSTTFSTLSHKRHEFWKKKLPKAKCVLIFSKTFIWNIYHSKKNSASYCHKCENVFM